MRASTPYLVTLFLGVLLAGSCEGSGEAAADGTDYALGRDSAELYEKALVPPLFGPWAEDLVDRARLAAGEHVLDLACGTGVVAREAAARVGPRGAVTGVDISPGMLAVARRTNAPEGAPIEWHEGDALGLSFADESFDVMLCQQAVQFFPDRAQAAQEALRVLRPGGRAAVSAWRGVAHNPYGSAVADVVERRIGAEAAAETSSPFAEEVGEELKETLDAAGFVDVRTEAVRIDMHTTDLETFVRADVLAYPLTGAALTSWTKIERDALVAEIVAELASYRTAAGWSIPFEAHVATGRRPGMAGG